MWQFFNRYLFPSKATLDKVNVSYTTSTFSVNKNEEFNIGVLLTAEGGKKISGADLIFKYNSNNKDVIDYQSFIQTPMEESILSSVSSADGAKNLRLSLASASPEADLKSSVLINIKVKAKNLDGSTIFGLLNTAQIVGPVAENKFEVVIPTNPISITVGAGDPSATPLSGTPPPPPPTLTSGSTPPSSSGATLNLKLKFQGITKKPANTTSMGVTVKVVGNGIEATTTTPVAFQADDSGIWQPTAPIVFNKTIPAGTGYAVFVKGDKNTQKKICVSTPTETSGGTYRCTTGGITLSSAVNTLDFSGIILMGGDLPVQDGVVNSYDTTLVRNNLGKKDTNALSIADINKDGIVDTQDYSLIIYALSFRFDEE